MTSKYAERLKMYILDEGQEKTETAASLQNSA